jgi:hypothetical protein
VETITGFGHLEELGRAAKAGNIGMVFGRVDFAGSLGRDRSFVNTPEMGAYIQQVAEICARHDLDLVVGGGVSPDSIDLLRKVRSIRLDRFETRKVIFDAAVLDGERTQEGLELAIEFELLWLKNKRDYYKTLAAEDETRIAMMEARQATALKVPA